MTQVEIPQLSLGRYVELLKRRRWQLVPVSLLGLLIGGLVAFFIPRYFVAVTVLVHQPTPGTETTREENPFAEIVDTAKSAIPLAIGETIAQLAWPEAMALDGFARDQFERAVEKRVQVDDGNAWQKKRTYAKLSVTYLDRDGERAATFLNKLVEVWIQKRLRELRQPAQDASQRAKEEADRYRQLLDGYTREKQDLERTYGIRPDLDALVQRQLLVDEVEQQQELVKERRQQGVALQVLEANLAVLRTQLAATAERVAPSSMEMQAKALASPEGKLLALGMLNNRLAMEQTFKPGTPGWLTNKRQYEASMQLLQNLTAQVVADPDGLMPNPEHGILVTKIAAAELRQVELRTDLELLDAELELRAQRYEGLSTGWRLYEKKLADIAETKTMREQAVEVERAATKALAELSAELPVRVERIAQTPPAPTEPNILVVALIGCILGLGTAIGLILLLDFVQGTYKTVEDVERGLSLPVLGGVAHLETAEERRRTVRGRRRISLVAAAMLTLITLVVLIYYFDPTRLPSVVRDLLGMVLGA